VDARSERWSSKYSWSSRRLCSCRDASVWSDASFPGQVPLGVLELRHCGPELRVEPLDPVEGRGDVGDLLLDEEDLRPELRVLLLEDRVLGGRAEEREVVTGGEQGDEDDGAPDVGSVLEPTSRQPELAHRLRVVGDHDDGKDLILRGDRHPVLVSNSRPLAGP